MLEEIKIENSKNIKSLFYFSDSKELWTFFQDNSLYIYKDVPNEIVDKIKSEKEKGKYFYANIREKYEYIKKY